MESSEDDIASDSSGALKQIDPHLRSRVSPADGVSPALKYINEHIETAYILDPSNTNNVISDDLTQAEKKAIAVQAGKSHDTPSWNATLW